MRCANRAGFVPVCGARLQMMCPNRASSVPVRGAGLKLQIPTHCVNRAGFVPVLCVGLQIRCSCDNRAGFVPVCGTRLQMHCANHAVLVHVALFLRECATRAGAGCSSPAPLQSHAIHTAGRYRGARAMGSPAEDTGTWRGRVPDQPLRACAGGDGAGAVGSGGRNSDYCQ